MSTAVSDNPVQVLILAGQRSKDGVPLPDALCQHAGVVWKALLPILERPMIQYVLDALSSSQNLKTGYLVSGLPQDVFTDLQTGQKQIALQRSPSGDGPANSVVQAVAQNPNFPLLVTTCDHALLTPHMVDHFIQNAQAGGKDFVVGIASKDIILPAYPHVKRTYLSFSDNHVSGCNLFYIANDSGMRAIEFWQSAQRDRKKPWKLARRLGIGMLFQYVRGRLGLDDCFEFVSRSLGIDAGYVLLPFAEAAIDVDKPSDLELVREILSKRG